MRKRQKNNREKFFQGREAEKKENTDDEFLIFEGKKHKFKNNTHARDEDET